MAATPHSNLTEPMAPAEIVVSDPVRVGGVKPFVLYRVTSRQFDDREVSVLRRYSDFDWLLERLRSDHKDCVVPPLPPKQLVGALEDDFIESRRRGLQRFLSRVAGHPKLSLNTDFELFMTATPEHCDFSEIRRMTGGLASIDDGLHWLGEKAVQLFRATKTRTTEAMAGMVGAKVLDDDPYEERLRRAVLLEGLYKRHAMLARSTVQRSLTSAAALLALGQSLSQFGRAEEDEDLAVVCVDLGNALVAVAGVNRVSAERDAELFEEPLAEAAGMAEAIRIAFENRRELKLDYLEAYVRFRQKEEEIEGLDLYGPSFTDSLNPEIARKAKEADLKDLVLAEQRLKKKLGVQSKLISSDVIAAETSLTQEASERVVDYAQRKVVETSKFITLTITNRSLVALRPGPRSWVTSLHPRTLCDRDDGYWSL